MFHTAFNRPAFPFSKLVLAIFWGWQLLAAVPVDLWSLTAFVNFFCIYLFVVVRGRHFNNKLSAHGCSLTLKTSALFIPPPTPTQNISFQLLFIWCITSSAVCSTDLHTLNLSFYVSLCFSLSIVTFHFLILSLSLLY